MFEILSIISRSNVFRFIMAKKLFHVLSNVVRRLKLPELQLIPFCGLGQLWVNHYRFGLVGLLPLLNFFNLCVALGVTFIDFTFSHFQSE